MVTLNDYLYSGSTIFRILNNYIRDLRKDAKVNHNEIDLVHSNFLIHIQEMLEHNDFLTAQSQKIREFYRYMAKESIPCIYFPGTDQISDPGRREV